MLHADDAPGHNLLDRISVRSKPRHIRRSSPATRQSQLRQEFFGAGEASKDGGIDHVRVLVDEAVCNGGAEAVANQDDSSKLNSTEKQIVVFHERINHRPDGVDMQVYLQLPDGHAGVAWSSTASVPDNHRVA